MGSRVAGVGLQPADSWPGWHMASEKAVPGPSLRQTSGSDLLPRSSAVGTPACFGTALLTPLSSYSPAHEIPTWQQHCSFSALSSSPNTEFLLYKLKPMEPPAEARHSAALGSSAPRDSTPGANAAVLRPQDGCSYTRKQCCSS